MYTEHKCIKLVEVLLLLLLLGPSFAPFCQCLTPFQTELKLRCNFGPGMLNPAGKSASPDASLKFHYYPSNLRRYRTMYSGYTWSSW